jgi:hypothetical protein
MAGSAVVAAAGVGARAGAVPAGAHPHARRDGDLRSSRSRLNPAKPWGNANPANCPKCGQPNLRQKRMELTRHTTSLIGGRGTSINTRTTTVTWSGIGTLCTTECGYTSVQSPNL